MQVISLTLAFFYLIIYIPLVHIGMAVWLIASIISILKGNIGFKLTKLKVLCAFAGMVATWPALLLLYYEEVVVAALINIVGFYITEYYFGRAGLGPFWWDILVIYGATYSVLGLIGGWGFGQMIHGLDKRFRPKHQKGKD